MKPHEISELTDAIRKRESEIVARVETWSKVNSGSDNPAGVAKMADLLQAELKLLTTDVQQMVLPVNVETDDDGKQIGRKLGPAVRAVLRPQAAIQVLLSGHLKAKRESFKKRVDRSGFGVDKIIVDKKLPLSAESLPVCF